MTEEPCTKTQSPLQLCHGIFKHIAHTGFAFHVLEVHSSKNTSQPSEINGGGMLPTHRGKGALQVRQWVGKRWTWMLVQLLVTKKLDSPGLDLPDLEWNVKRHADESAAASLLLEGCQLVHTSSMGRLCIGLNFTVQSTGEGAGTIVADASGSRAADQKGAQAKDTIWGAVDQAREGDWNGTWGGHGV